MTGKGAKWRLEPYRIFFPLGYLFAILGLGIWVIDYLETSFPYPGKGHAVLMMQGFAFSFSLGVLLTELPKSLGRIEPPPWTHLVLFVSLLMAMAASALAQIIALSQVFYLLIVLCLMVYLALTLILKREGRAHPDLVFTGASTLFALSGAVVWLLAEAHSLPPEILRWAQLACFQAYFLLFAFSTFHWEAAPAKIAWTVGRRTIANTCLAVLLLLLITAEAFAPTWFPAHETLALRLAHAGKAGMVLGFILAWVPRAGPAYQGAARYALWSILAGFVFTIFIPGKSVALSHFTYIAGFCWLVLARGAVLVALRSSVLLPLTRRGTLIVYGSLLAMGGILRALADFTSAGRPLLLLLSACFVLIPIILWASLFLPSTNGPEKTTEDRFPT